jgi:hypothetical protein
MLFQGLQKAFLRRLERGVEQHDVEPGAAQAGGSQQGLQGRVRLHLAQLLAVVSQVVGMGEKDIRHGFL